MTMLSDVMHSLGVLLAFFGTAFAVGAGLVAGILFATKYGAHSVDVNVHYKESPDAR